MIQRGRHISVDDTVYDVLQDNDAGLVAVASFSEWVKRNDTPIKELSLGTFVILIEKKTMRFRRGNLWFGDDDPATRYGKCTRD